MWLLSKKKRCIMLRNKGILHAIALILYISGVAYVMVHGNTGFEKNNPFLGSLLFLTVFVMSALLCTLIVFYKPYLLFIKGKRQDAIEFVVSITLWLAVFVSSVFIALMLFA